MLANTLELQDLIEFTVTTILIAGPLVQLIKSQSVWSRHKADHFYLILRLRMHGAIPPFPIFVAWSLIRCRDYCTFSILLSFCSRCVLYKFWRLVTVFGVLWPSVLKESIRNISEFILKKLLCLIRNVLNHNSCSSCEIVSSVCCGTVLLKIRILLCFSSKYQCEFTVCQ